MNAEERRGFHALGFRHGLANRFTPPEDANACAAYTIGNRAGRRERTRQRSKRTVRA